MCMSFVYVYICVPRVCSPTRRCRDPQSWSSRQLSVLLTAGPALSPAITPFWFSHINMTWGELGSELLQSWMGYKSHCRWSYALTDSLCSLPAPPSLMARMS